MEDIIVGLVVLAAVASTFALLTYSIATSERPSDDIATPAQNAEVAPAPVLVYLQHPGQVEQARHDDVDEDEDEDEDEDWFLNEYERRHLEYLPGSFHQDGWLDTSVPEAEAYGFKI